MLVSVAWLLGSLLVLFPWLRGGADWPYFKERYGAFGNNFSEVARTLLTQPWRALPYVAGLHAVTLAVELVAPLAFLPLRQPLILALAAPTWAILLLSSFGAMHNAGSRYMAPVIVCVFVAAIVGLRQSLSPVSPGSALEPLTPTQAEQARKRGRRVLFLTVLFSLAISQTPVRFPFKRIPFLTPHERARNALAERLPPDASVSTQPEFFGHVSNRVEAYVGYHPGTEYVLVDPTPDYTGHPTWYDHAGWNLTLPLLLSRHQYEIVDRADGALLLRRTGGQEMPMGSGRHGGVRVFRAGRRRTPSAQTEEGRREAAAQRR
jgi:uncharacterized membrane protein